MQKVTGRTRVSGDYKEIVCPKCKTVIRVRHFSWSSLHCETCSSIVPKLDWIIKDTPAAKLGRKGGQAKSEAKTKAARANAKMPRGKWATAIAYEFRCTKGELHHGVALKSGKMKSFVYPADEIADMEATIKECNPWEQKHDVDEFLILAGRSRLI